MLTFTFTLITLVMAQKCSLSGYIKNVLYSGEGLGSYYYDVNDGMCPHESVTYPENNGIASCESYFPGPNQQTLKQRGDNNLLAIDNALLAQPGGRSKFCGKRVVVRYNGVLVNETFAVWDGCAACANGARLDFSMPALRNIDPNACQLGLLPKISWNVVDESVITFVP